MKKITFIGAGSTVFARNLIGDLLYYPEFAECTISLFDIDPERLHTTERVTQWLAEKSNAHPRIELSTDRKQALEGADYAINMIQVGGYKPGTVIDFEIPKKYGLRQTIADTLGIGGVMRALRTIPVLLSMADDMCQVCPDVLHLNYVNPMAMNVWALERANQSSARPIKTVGLCHSVYGTASQLAEDIAVPVEEINYVAAGINHMAFYLKFERDGEDLTPLIRKVLDEGRVPDWNRVRYEIFKRLGYFVTESSEHFSEYTPWFIKRDRPDLVERFNVPLDEYIRRCEEQIAGWELLKVKLENMSLDTGLLIEQARQIGLMDEKTAGEMRSAAVDFESLRLSGEYGPQIIHSIETGTPRVVYGNVPNRGLIDNLPQECIVEVPCLVDKNGVQPVRIGALPPHLAALIQTNVNVQALTVEAALSGKREHIYHAAMLDPHTAAELDLDQIWAMVDELIEAHGEYLTF